MKDLLDSSDVIDMENEEENDDFIDIGSVEGFNGMIVNDGTFGDEITISAAPTNDDVVTEEDLPDGTHIKKEVHTENGV